MHGHAKIKLYKLSAVATKNILDLCWCETFALLPNLDALNLHYILTASEKSCFSLQN